MKQRITDIENRYGLKTPLCYYDIFQCLHELFRKQAALLPDNPAVIDDSGKLTYGELNEAANRLARAVVQNGIAPGSFIGLCTGRSS